MASAGRGSVHVGYGAIIAAQLDDDHDDDDEIDAHDGPPGFDELSRWQWLWQRYIIDLWVNPRQAAVKRVVDKWWSRYGLVVFLPALLVREPGEWR